MKKTRTKNKEKEKDTKTENGVEKVVKMGRYNNGEKYSFLFKKKQTNERNEKERTVLWEEKENDEREGGPETKRTELRQRWLFQKKKNKGIKTKGSKQGAEKT